jgi:hypothetical protein
LVPVEGVVAEALHKPVQTVATCHKRAPAAEEAAEVLGQQVIPGAPVILDLLVPLVLHLDQYHPEQTRR